MTNNETPSQTFARLCGTKTPEELRERLIETLAADRSSFPIIRVESFFLTNATPLWSPIPDPSEKTSNQISSYIVSLLAETTNDGSVRHVAEYRNRFGDERSDRPELVRTDVFHSNLPYPDSVEDVVFLRVLDERFNGPEFREESRDLFVYHKFWSCAKVCRRLVSGKDGCGAAPS